MIQLIFLNISGHYFLYNFHINYSIKDLRSVISLDTGIPCQETRLIYCYNELYDNQYLNNFDIGTGSCIQIKLRIKCGMNNDILPKKEMPLMQFSKKNLKFKFNKYIVMEL